MENLLKMFRNLLESVAGNEVAELMTNCSDINHQEITTSKISILRVKSEKPQTKLK